MKETVDEIREKGYKIRTVTVKMRFSDFKTLTRAKTLPEPTGDLVEIKKAAFECLGRIDLKRKVRLIGIRLSGHERLEM
jgi:DNA polymerase-4